MSDLVAALPVPDQGRAGPELATDVPREPIRIRMTAVLLLAAALVVAELVAGLLVGVAPHLLVLGMCLSAAVLFGLVFCLGAITIAGFAAGAATAGVTVVLPGHLPLVLVCLAVLAIGCGLAPGWARVEAWQAVRSAPLSSREENAAAHVPLAALRRADLPSRLRVRWRTDRVVAAFLVLAFPPVFVTGAVAFMTWTQNR